MNASPNHSDLKEQLRKSVILGALEQILKHDDEPFLRLAARCRYEELTNPKELK